MPHPGRGRSRLLHTGNVIVDLVARVPAMPSRGGDVLASSMGATVGGGFNLMAAAARQGQPVSYAGAHGTGPFGDLARAAMRAAGIDVLQPPRLADTPVVMVIVDDGGERTLISSPAGVAGPTAAELAAVRPGPGDAVSVTGYGLLDPASRSGLVPWVRELPPEVLVVLDPGPLAASAEPAALVGLLERADWCTATAREASEITGVAEPRRAAAELARRTVRGAVVRTGAAGCVLAEVGEAPVVVPGVPVRAIDTTGAGDTHTGVFVAALLAGLPAADATRTANEAAAFAVTVPGSATAPTTAELAEFRAVLGCR
jgi:sugar/nucleoside kinase (ribokinase family)